MPLVINPLHPTSNQKFIANRINSLMVEQGATDYRSMYPIIKYALESCGFSVNIQLTANDELKSVIVDNHGADPDAELVIACVLGVIATASLSKNLINSEIP